MNSDNYIEDVQEDPDRHALTLAVHFIIDRTYTVWNERKQPYFVSLINPDLKKIGVDLKKVIFPETVKNFVQNNLLNYVKIVSHPSRGLRLVLYLKQKNSHLLSISLLSPRSRSKNKLTPLKFHLEMR